MTEITTMPVSETLLTPAKAHLVPDVQYVFELSDYEGNEFLRVEEPDAFARLQPKIEAALLSNAQASHTSDKQNSPVFTVITKATGYDKRLLDAEQHKKLKLDKKIQEVLGEKTPKDKIIHQAPKGEEDVEHLEITEVMGTRIVIESEPLLDAIRETVDYYPEYGLYNSFL
jgi:hypothetical protein